LISILKVSNVGWVEGKDELSVICIKVMIKGNGDESTGST